MSYSRKPIMEFSLESIMSLALNAARAFRGATSPNPPVGAVGLAENNRILAIGTHQRAGSPHAEINVIEKCRAEGTMPLLHTLVITLEPCNHTGRTPPCTEAILRTPVRRVIVGCQDPNPMVTGKGMNQLKTHGLDVIEGVLATECQELIRPFAKWITRHQPWVTVKTALTTEGSMAPPTGQKTFTSPESLKLAHELRKRADAILTGSGTILADNPLFTVRLVPDFQDKRRHLIVLDRRKRVPQSYFSAAQERGFVVSRWDSLREALDFLARQGVLEALVEAGPALSQAVLESELWDEHISIQQSADRDDVRRTLRAQMEG